MDSLGARKLPKCFVIGAQKGGTSALHSWLSLQNELSLPRFKETHFFSDENKYSKGEEWYLSNFTNSKGGKLLVEVDPDYLTTSEAPERISRAYVESEIRPKFICLLRNRIERARSQWMMTRRRGMESRDFTIALRDSFENQEDCDGNNDYYARGLYAKNLEVYKILFPDSEFYVTSYEDLFLSENKEEEFEKILLFMGVKGDFISPNYEKKINPSGEARSGYISRMLANRDSVVRKFSRVVIPSNIIRIYIGRFLEKMNNKPVNNQNFSGEIDQRIIDAYNDDSEKMEMICSELINRNS